MKPRDIYDKALYSLDHDRSDDGVRLLHAVITGAEKAGDVYTLGRALCCLGDVLAGGTQPASARPYLERCLLIGNDDDVLDEEYRIARELLNQII